MRRMRVGPTTGRPVRCHLEQAPFNPNDDLSPRESSSSRVRLNKIAAFSSYTVKSALADEREDWLLFIELL